MSTFSLFLNGLFACSIVRFLGRQWSEDEFLQIEKRSFDSDRDEEGQEEHSQHQSQKCVCCTESCVVVQRPHVGVVEENVIAVNQVETIS
jgi:hypothetical protein